MYLSLSVEKKRLVNMPYKKAPLERVRRGATSAEPYIAKIILQIYNQLFNYARRPQENHAVGAEIKGAT